MRTFITAIILLFGLGAGPAFCAEPARFALGVGYPDLRERFAVVPGLDLELKVALTEGMQGYGSRLYLMPFGGEGLRGGVGGEGGVLNFSDRQGLSGHGFYAGGFVGFDYRFAGRWMLNADIGPAWLRLVSQGQAVESVEWVYNTALYFYLF